MENRKLGRLQKTRWLVVCAAVMLIWSQPGCQIFKRFQGQPKFAGPVVFTQQPTKEQLLQHIQNQTQGIEQLQSDVRVSIDGMPTLRGNLAVEKPNRLRLNAGLLGVTELGIDVGSNEDVFWFWAKVANPGQEPVIYFANHDEYRNSPLQRTIPIEPSWLIDALGLLQFEPGDRVEGPFMNQDGRLQLRTYRTIGNQRTLRTSLIDPQFGLIVQQAIYDERGKLLAYANPQKHQHYPEYNISLPNRIVITAYDPDGNAVQLTVNASRFKINSIFGDPKQLWSMPNPGDVPMFNLVHGLESFVSDQSSTAFNALGPRSHRTSSNLSTSGRTLIDNIR